MLHQDWNDVVFNKQSSSKKPHFEMSKDQKIYNESENLSHDNVGLSLGKQIQKARIAQGYKTQKELATAINTRPDIIASYEIGKAIPDSSILQKLRRILKTQFKVVS
jgi:putative transcription factor